jgi:hypothetical protein
MYRRLCGTADSHELAYWPTRMGAESDDSLRGTRDIGCHANEMVLPVSTYSILTSA